MKIKLCGGIGIRLSRLESVVFVTNEIIDWCAFSSSNFCWIISFFCLNLLQNEKVIDTDRLTKKEYEAYIS